MNVEMEKTSLFNDVFGVGGVYWLEFKHNTECMSVGIWVRLNLYFCRGILSGKRRGCSKIGCGNRFFLFLFRKLIWENVMFNVLTNDNIIKPHSRTFTENILENRKL